MNNVLSKTNLQLRVMTIDRVIFVWDEVPQSKILSVRTKTYVFMLLNQQFHFIIMEV